MNARRAGLALRARLGLDDFPVDAAWAPDGASCAIACGEGALVLVDFKGTAPAVHELGRHAGGALALAWQPAGPLFASSGADGRVLLWDVRTRAARELLRGTAWSEHLAFARHGKWLAAASGREILVFDAQGAELARFADHPGTINAIAWRPKPVELAALSQGGLRLHRLEPVATVAFDWNAACLTASWSPDGRIIASGLQEGAVHFWNVATTKQSEMKGYGSKVQFTSFSANSRLLATAAGELIVVWDFGGAGPEGSTPRQLRAHTERVTQLAFQPEGPCLASGARDRRLLLWQPALGAEPLDADLLGDEVALLRWSRDGRRLLAGDRAGRLSLYALAAPAAGR